MDTESETMNDQLDPNDTVANDKDSARTADVHSISLDSHDISPGSGAGVSTPRPSPRVKLTVLLKEAEGESSHAVKPQSDAMPTREEAGDRYHLSGEIARGGMGAVLRGRDVDLGRDLAVKVLLEKYANRPDVSRRFIEEAQIGGQLQHPGVVPVYDIGRFGDRPYFTMKLVKGQTLAAILSERTDAGADHPRLLGIALHVSQAMAYAHAKGVIHRDLKPANIMVGAFGEVQVMDWGLAKVLAEGGVADEERASRGHQKPDETTIRTARSTGSSGGFGTDTEAGSILGTPAYMPPEQASGDIAQLDRRADVFALGAILCEILTGKPPYLGRSSEEVRRKAANGDLADAMARLDACKADSELIALTKACLAPEAIDRPKEAQAVVDSLTTYFDGVQQRLQTAERERAVALVREMESRKRRKVQFALACALFAMMLGGGSFVWWRNEQVQLVRRREARNSEALAALLDRCAESLRGDDAANAELALEAARKRLAEGGADSQAERLKRLEADLTLIRNLNAVDRFIWTPGIIRLGDKVITATKTRDALRQFGADPEVVSANDARARVAESVVRERIVSVLDRLLMPERLVDVQKIPSKERYLFTPEVMADIAAMAPKTASVRTLLRLVDGDLYRDAVRDAIVADDRETFVRLAGQNTALEQPPGFVAFLAMSNVISVERRRHLLRVGLVRRPADLNLLMLLGGSLPLNESKWYDERVRWYQAATAAAPANSLVHQFLGNVLKSKGELNEAIACYKKSLELDPNDGNTLSHLGGSLLAKGLVDDSIACYRKAIEIGPKMREPIAHWPARCVTRVR